MSFPASYAGTCGGCGEHFGPGVEITYNDGVLVVDDCCGDAPTGLATRELKGPDPVFPRGKTKKDRCGTCFQVPASNGACGYS
jgi:hypothetical protein